jgi:hypothetical protein
MVTPRRAQFAAAINCERLEFHGIHLSTEGVPRKGRLAGWKIAMKIVRLCGGG